MLQCYWKIQHAMCTIHSGVHNLWLIYSKWKKKTLISLLSIIPTSTEYLWSMQTHKVLSNHVELKRLHYFINQLKKKKHFFSKLLLESLIELVAFVVSILYQRDWVKALWGSGMILFVYFNKDASYQTLVEGYCFYEKIIIQ